MILLCGGLEQHTIYLDLISQYYSVLKFYRVINFGLLKINSNDQLARKDRTSTNNTLRQNKPRMDELQSQRSGHFKHMSS